MDRTSQKQDFSYCLDLLRNHAPDFYLADLLLPQKWRSDIVALHAFHVEITNITLSGGEPLARQMRLQWWQDALSGSRPEEAAGNPVTRLLLDCVKRHELPVSSLVNKLEAHIFDLYNDTMGDRTMFEGYCGETRSSLFQLAALIAETETGPQLANACGHSGVVAGTIAVLENMVFHRQTGQVFVPADLLMAAGLNGAGFITKQGEAHRNVVAAMVDLGWEHHNKAIAAIAELPVHSRVVFKPVGLFPLYLTKVSKNPGRVFTDPKPISQLSRQWALWRF